MEGPRCGGTRGGQSQRRGRPLARGHAGSPCTGRSDCFRTLLTGQDRRARRDAPRRDRAASRGGERRRRGPEVSTIDTGLYQKRLEEERTRLLHALGFLQKENPGSISDELGELAEG